MILVGLLHHLDPLNSDGVLDTVLFGLELGQFGDLFEGEHAQTPVNEELKVLLDLVAAQLEDFFAHLTSGVRDFWLELDGVLVDTSDVLGVEVDREVVREELEFTSGSS